MTPFSNDINVNYVLKLHFFQQLQKQSRCRYYYPVLLNIWCLKKVSIIILLSGNKTNLELWNVISLKLIHSSIWICSRWSDSLEFQKQVCSLSYFYSPVTRQRVLSKSNVKIFNIDFYLRLHLSIIITSSDISFQHNNIYQFEFLLHRFWGALDL